MSPVPWHPRGALSAKLQPLSDYKSVEETAAALPAAIPFPPTHHMNNRWAKLYIFRSCIFFPARRCEGIVKGGYGLGLSTAEASVVCHHSGVFRKADAVLVRTLGQALDEPFMGARRGLRSSAE